MKQHLELKDRQDAPQRTNDFINEYQLNRHGIIVQQLSLGQIEEMRIVISGKLHHDTSDQPDKQYNNILYGAESVVGWEGKERIDIEWFQLKEEIKQLFERYDRQKMKVT